MNFFRHIIEKLDRNTNIRHYFKRGLFGAAAVVVFVTIYSLILPAVAVDHDQAEEMSGLYLEGASSEDEGFVETAAVIDHTDEAEDTQAAVPEPEFDENSTPADEISHGAGVTEARIIDGNEGTPEEGVSVYDVYTAENEDASEVGDDVEIAEDLTEEAGIESAETWTEEGVADRAETWTEEGVADRAETRTEEGVAESAEAWTEEGVADRAEDATSVEDGAGVEIAEDLSDAEAGAGQGLYGELEGQDDLSADAEDGYSEEEYIQEYDEEYGNLDPEHPLTDRVLELSAESGLTQVKVLFDESDEVPSGSELILKEYHELDPEDAPYYSELISAADQALQAADPEWSRSGAFIFNLEVRLPDGSDYTPQGKTLVLVSFPEALPMNCRSVQAVQFLPFEDGTTGCAVLSSMLEENADGAITGCSFEAEQLADFGIIRDLSEDGEAAPWDLSEDGEVAPVQTEDAGEDWTDSEDPAPEDAGEDWTDSEDPASEDAEPEQIGVSEHEEADRTGAEAIDEEDAEDLSTESDAPIESGETDGVDQSVASIEASETDGADGADQSGESDATIEADEDDEADGADDADQSSESDATIEADEDDASSEDEDPDESEEKADRVRFESSVIEASGRTYEITVSYEADARIPSDAKLMVAEILPGDKRYMEYYTSAIDAVAEDADAGSGSENADAGSGSGSVSETDQNLYARFFDIQILSGGDKIEPEGDVLVSITLKDAPDMTASDLKIVHFDEDEPSVLEADQSANEADGEAELVFVADSFSVFGVITVPGHETVNESKTQNLIQINDCPLRGVA